MSAPVGDTATPRNDRAGSEAGPVIEELGDGWVSGNLGRDPELRFTPTGQCVANFSIAHSVRIKNEESGVWEDSNVTWYRVTVWGAQGERAAEHLQRGDRVIVGGKLTRRTWKTKQGDTRSGLEITARDLGPSLLRADVHIVRAERSHGDRDPWEGR